MNVQPLISSQLRVHPICGSFIGMKSGWMFTCPVAFLNKGTPLASVCVSTPGGMVSKQSVNHVFTNPFEFGFAFVLLQQFIQWLICTSLPQWIGLRPMPSYILSHVAPTPKTSKYNFFSSFAVPYLFSRRPTVTISFPKVGLPRIIFQCTSRKYVH